MTTQVIASHLYWFEPDARDANGSLLVPRGTPRGIVERLHREIVTALQQPEVASRLAREGLEGVGTSPREFAAHLKFEHETWARVIKRAGIRAE